MPTHLGRLFNKSLGNNFHTVTKGFVCSESLLKVRYHLEPGKFFCKYRRSSNLELLSGQLYRQLAAASKADSSLLY